MDTSDRNRRAIWLVVLALVGVGVLAHAPVLFGGETFAGGSHLSRTVPAQQHLAESIADGRIPLWWDGVGLGVPFAADPSNAALYPPAWLTAVLPMPWAIDFLLVLHVVFAGIGCALFTRRLGAEPISTVVAGGCFMVGGFVSSAIVHGAALFAIAWMPWVAIAADRLAAAQSARGRASAAALLAAVQAVQLFAGDPALAVTTALLALGVVIARAERRAVAVGSFAAASCGAVILAAAVVLPALYLLGDGSRSGGPEQVAPAMWSMHPARLLEWVFPGALGDPNEPARHLARSIADASGGARGAAPSWALGVYAGLPVVLLAGLGVARAGASARRLAVIGAVLAVLAVGRFTPLYRAYRAIVVPEWAVRHPEEHLAGVFLVLAVLAGLGLSSVVRTGLSRRAAVGVAIAAGAAVAAVVAGWVAQPVIAAWIGDRSSLDVDAAVGGALGDATAAVVVLVAACAAGYLATRPAQRRWALPAAAAIVVGHLVGHTWTLLPRIDRAHIARPPALLASVTGDGDRQPRARLYRPRELRRLETGDSPASRAASAHDTAAANAATRFGLTYARGESAAHDQRAGELWYAAASAGEKLLDLFDVEYVVLPAMSAVPTGLTELARDPAGDVMLLRNERRRSRAFVAPRWTRHADDRAVTDELFAPGAGMLLGTIRFVGDGPAAEAGEGPLPAPPCEVNAPRPERVTLRCTSSTGGYAVLLDAWAPGWSATVDGEGAPVERADVVARAVPIGPGAHVIDLRYRAPGFAVGGVITLLAWLNLIALAYVLRRSRPSAL